MRVALGELMHMGYQGLAVGVVGDAQTNLSALASDRTDNGRSIVIICAMPSAFVGPAARRVGWISMCFAFFPRVLKHFVCFSPFIG